MARTLCYLALVLGIATALFTSAHAQLGIYALGKTSTVFGPNIGTTTPAGANGSFTAHGETFGVYNTWGHGGPVGFGMDARLTFQSSANNTPYGNTFGDGVISARAAFKTPLLRLRPYVQAGIAIGNTNYGRYTSNSGSTAQAMKSLAARITRSSHISTSAPSTAQANSSAPARS